MVFALRTSVVVCVSLAGGKTSTNCLSTCQRSGCCYTLCIHITQRTPTMEPSLSPWPPPCCVWRCATSRLQGSIRTPIGTTIFSFHTLRLSAIALSADMFYNARTVVTSCHICFRNSWDSQLVTAHASEDPWQNSSLHPEQLTWVPCRSPVGRRGSGPSGSQRVPRPGPSLKAVAPRTESRR